MARLATIACAALAVFAPAFAAPVETDDFMDIEFFELAAAPTETPSFNLKSIVEIAVADKTFSKLVQALTAADLVTALQGAGPFTVFAPTDAAFDMIKEAPDMDTLKKILKYHVVSGEYPSSAVKPGQKVELETLAGDKITIENKDGKIMVDGANVIAADVDASNGVVHVIDKVLIPHSAMDGHDHAAETKPAPAAKDSIAALAMKTADLSTLLGLAVKANLADTLGGEGPFTVFAPVNSAFKSLKAVPEGDALKNVLLYHVVKGKVLSKDLKDGQKVETLNGKMLTVKVGKDGVTVNGVKVNTPDVEASNGVVHLIDGVLIP